jgi:Mn2+/Fe2+ NRAMP family transporter
VQEICGRIGAVTGQGLAGVLRRHYPRPLLIVLVSLLFIANTVNIGADIAAVASGFELITGVSERVLIVPVAVGIAFSEIVVPYRVFANYLKLLTLILFAYIADAFVAAPDWGAALRATLIPRLAFDAESITTLVAVLGTTISPYLFFWETSEEVEELHRRGVVEASAPEISRMRIDTNIGMFLANIVFYFIVLTTAATLYPAGIRHIDSARDAAGALRPLAGDRATLLFALGFIGTGLLSIPVLSASAAYAIAEVFDWREGLEASPREAPQFYVVIALATLIGLGIAVSGVGAIRALFIAAIVNGVISPILIGAIVLVANDARVLGRHRNGALSNVLGIGAALIMGAAALTMLAGFVLAA